ncbi:MAG: glycosyltransferase [Planctomycetes bacterium]|nr:glycosyltransferase [Planctomycetota bacterium]
MSRRHVLLVSWWFPPLAGGGVHRPLQFTRHLVRRGFRVSVLTGVPPRTERQDAELLAQLPREVRVVRAPLIDPFRAWAWLKARGGVGATPAIAPAIAAVSANGAARPRWQDLVTEAIALPDRFLPWLPLAVARAALAWRGDEPELVFSTSPPHTMHLVGKALAGLFHCPHVVDFRDPWMGNPFRRYARERFRQIDAALERRVAAGATQVVLNTPALERQFRARYPGFDRARTICNGFDPDAFANLPPPTGGAFPGGVEIAHFGQLYGLRSGKFLLQALARVKKLDAALFARLRLTFIGSIDGEAGFRAQAVALGIESALSIPGALPHAQSLRRQRQADVLLLLGPENREPEVQVPGKLYEYFAAERPILTLSRAGGAIAEILDLAGVEYERAEPDDPEAIAAALVRVAARVGSLPGNDLAQASTSKFRYDRLGDQLIEVFEAAWSAAARAVPATLAASAAER